MTLANNGVHQGLRATVSIALAISPPFAAVNRHHKSVLGLARVEG